MNRHSPVTTTVFATVAAVTSQTVLLTAFLYYFGWVRSQATISYFGVPPSLMELTAADYALRSLNSVFLPLISAALICLALLGIHRFVVRRALMGKATRRLSLIIGLAQVAGIVLAGVALIGVVLTGWLLVTSRTRFSLGIALPLTLVASAILLGYAGYLRSLRDDNGTASRSRKGSENENDAEERAGQHYMGLRAATLLIAGFLGVLWSTSIYAGQVGERFAREYENSLRELPEVVVYSTERIALTGHGVVVNEIRQFGSKYQYRYRGLRFFRYTRDRYILLPVGWQKGRDSIFIIPDNDTVRIDFIAY